MGMFSQHFLIRGPAGGYWDGGLPDSAENWTNDYQQAVRFFTRASAEAVLRGVLAPVADACRIDEDE